MYSLRLVNDSARPVLFTANSYSLASQLHSAFVEFCKCNNLSRALLETHHEIHGWNQVCDCKKNYVIINNPLTLNYADLARAVAHTLYECDQWPTAQEKRSLKRQRQAQERELMAEARRKAFRLL